MILAAAALVVITAGAVAVAWRWPTRSFLPSAVSERWLVDTFYTYGKSGDL
jgi:hypothetical protein